MKRIYTFDLLRGLAIAVVVVGHRINWDYYRQHAEAQSLSAGLLVFSLFITMAGIFFCISGAVNAYVNYDRLASGKQTPKQVLLKSLVTGSILIVISLLFRYFMLRTIDDVVSVNVSGEVLSYNETGVLPYLILYGVYPVKYNITVLFMTGPIQMIAYSIITVSVVLVLYHKIRGLHDTRGLRKLFLILGIIVFLVSGLTHQFLLRPAVRARSIENIVGMFFLSPLVLGNFSIFPHLAFGFFGAYFGVAFARKDAEPKSVLRSMLWFWSTLSAMGIAILAVCIPLGVFDTWISGWGRKLLQLGIYFCLFWIGMKFIDFQPEETKQKRIKWLKLLAKIGRVTFTVFILEGIVAVSLQRLISPVWAGWNVSFGNAALFGLINFAVWIVIITIWNRFGFIGSVEWISAWLVRKLSGQKSGKMDKI
jgi:hypothetical protein